MSDTSPAFDAEQRSLLERIAHGAPLRALLTDVTRLVERQADGMLCTVLLVDAERGTVHPIAAPSLPTTYTSALEGAKIGAHAGSCGTAAFRRERVIVADIATHPYWTDYREIALSHGLQACWSTPIVSGEREVLGTFAMYYREARGPTPIELSWVDAAIDVAKIAIVRDRSEQRLRASELRYRTLANERNKRVKELTLMHGAARLLQQDLPADQALLDELVSRIPLAFQVPALCEAQILYGEMRASTPAFSRVYERLTESFDIGERKGYIEVGYRHATEGTGNLVLPEEQELIRSIADMLSAHFGRSRAVLGLRASEERLRAVVEHTPNVAVQWLDARGRLVFVNRASLAMFGWDMGDAIGKTLDELNFSSGDAERIAVSVQQVAATGEPVGPIELSFKRPDGLDGTLVSTVFAIPTADDGSCFVSTAVELTEHKRAQEAARAAKDERLKIEQKLRDAERMNALGVLASTIAHDFNNILAAVRGHTDLALLQSRGDSSMRHSLDEVRKACVRANMLVRQILTYGQRGAPEREALGLRTVIEEALGLLTSTLPSRVELRTSIAPGGHHALADATQVHQVIMNVATNAIQAMHDRAGTIEIMLDSVAVGDGARIPGLASGQYERLRVVDQGAGMSEQTLARAFEPFFTTKAANMGTGLGLSVVDGIMKSHKGAVHVDSTPGRGTTFDLYFPAVEDPLTENMRAVRLPRIGAEHVLYVDDDPGLVFLGVRLLRRMGYRATGMSDSNEALTAFRSRPYEFDAVVTDVGMPTLSGPELVREVKRVRPGVRTLLVSGYVDDLANAGSADADRVARKPRTIDELGEVLRELLV